LRECDEVLDAQQASLRRVAHLVAHGASSAEVFVAIARELAQVLRITIVQIWRYEPDGTATVVGAWSEVPQPFQAGTNWRFDDPTIGGFVQQVHAGRPVRVDDFAEVAGTAADAGRVMKITSAAGAPILVGGELWGLMGAAAVDGERLPERIEDRLADFAELVATAVSNAQARAESRALAEEQAALRRVATLVAHGVPSGELFETVTREVGKLLDADLAGMIRYDEDDTVTAVATWAAEGDHPEVRGLSPVEGDRLATTIQSTGRPAREDGWRDVTGPIGEFVREHLGVRSAVGSPIVVEGRVWGALLVHLKPNRVLPSDAESRLANFTELVATAVLNAQAGAEVHRLAEGQAALRRVATLVARGVPPGEVWNAIAEEVQDLFCPDAGTGLLRLEHDGRVTLVGVKSPLAIKFGDSYVPEKGAAALAIKTRRPARVDREDPEPLPPGSESPEFGSPAWRRIFRAQVAAPIAVEGRLWGVTVISWMQQTPPPGIEARVAEFTELLAMALANADSRAELAASRVRLVEAADAERRRVVRDLHDGAQQRLVHTVVTLKLARRALERGDEAGPTLVAEALDHAQQTSVELRELSHGILPAVLTRGGLGAGVEAVASRMPVPVDVGVSVGRLPAAVEATAYFVVAEALTNVAKHSHAGRAEVTARVEHGTLRLRVRDDGVGGARSEGTGLVGLADRLSALGGRLHVESPPGGGTLVAADLPLPG
jgi:signal transduction histidine kinase